MSLPFENKYAIVTGGSRGIGASIALLLAERGARGVRFSADYDSLYLKYTYLTFAFARWLLPTRATKLQQMTL